MKKSFRVIRILALSLVLLSLCVGAYILLTSDEGEAPSLLPVKESTYAEYNPTQDNVKTIGRTYYENEVRYFSYSGSGIEFSFKGEYVCLNIIADAIETQAQNHRARFAVYRDGQLLYDEVLSESEKQYYIYPLDSKKETVVTLIKLSEAKYSSFGVGKIGAHSRGKIMPTAQKDVKIEFIGDSISCGYGVDEENINGGFSTATENFTKTYAYVTAQNLNADYSVVAFSGYGVVSGYTSNGVQNKAATIAQYYDKSAFLSYGRDGQWNFPDFDSDFVVINLGTNDASYCSKSYERRQMFTSEYVSLISTVRECNPNAYILCILGDMNNSLYSCIELAVARYKEESGDSQVEAMTVEYRMDINDIVIDGHPGHMSNIYAGGVLSEKIYSLLQQS